MNFLERTSFSLTLIIISTLSIFGQTETLSEKVASAIKKELPELIVVEPLTLLSPYQTTEQRIDSRWKTEDGRTVSISFLIVGDLDKKAKEEDFRQYLFRAIEPPNRRIEGIGEKAILVSRDGEVEIRFFKKNLRVDIRFAFPAESKGGFYGPAPKAEEERAIKIAQVIDKTIDGQKTLSPCYNDFQKPPFIDGNTTEDKLFTAIAWADVSQVRKLIAKSINLDSVLSNFPHLKTYKVYGNKVIHAAANQGCLEIIQLLVKNKADVNVKNLLGETPLMLAVREGHLEIVRFLLESGADVTLKNKYGGKNAAFYVFDFFSLPFRMDTSPQPQIEILKLLAKYGLNLKEKESQNGDNLLLSVPCSWKSWCPEMIDFLLDQGLDINEANNQGRTVLMNVVDNAMLYDYWRRPEKAILTLKILVKRGVNVNVHDNNKSVLENVITIRNNARHNEKAVLQRLDEVIQILKEAGAN